MQNAEYSERCPYSLLRPKKAKDASEWDQEVPPHFIEASSQNNRSIPKTRLEKHVLRINIF